MAGEWRKVTVAAFAPFAYGKGLPEHQRDSSGHVPVFGSNGVVGFHGEALTSGPTVVIGRKGTVGAVHYSPKPCWPIDTTFYVVDPDPCVLRFKYYLLKALGLEHMNADSAVPGLNRDAAHSREVLVPPLAEQRAIAHILGALDDKIELNRRMNATLEAMARALFKSWFVDFDPVRAKMEGRWRRGQSLPGLPAHLWDLFPDRLVDSELGEIPEGWTPASLGDIADNPRRSVKPDVVPPTMPYVGLEHMPRRCIALDTWARADEVASGKSRFKEDEILFGKLRPYFHKVGIAPVDGVCSTDILVIVPKCAEWHSYVLLLVSSKAFVDYTDARSAGTKMPRTNWADMARYPLALPPLNLAKAFEDHVAGFRRRITTNVRQNRRLASLRDALLPKLLSGEIDVSGLDGLADPPAQAGEVP